MFIEGDSLISLQKLESESVDCCITSPPYWALRNYGVDGQLGLESTFQEYLDKLIAIFLQVKRVLKKTGSCWVVLGDTYSGSGGAGGDYNKGGIRAGQPKYKQIKPKNIPNKSLCMIPSRFAIAMVDHGWCLRNQIIWEKPNCMYTSARDRFTVSFEHVFFFTKSKKYYFAKGDETKCSVWKIPAQGYNGVHYAVYPEKLIEPMVKAGCPHLGVVLDPFMGSGTTCIVAQKLGRKFIGIDLNPDYIKLAESRLGLKVFQ